MDTPVNQRQRIIALWRDARFSQRQIARATNIPLSTVNRICKRFEDQGNVNIQRKGRCGPRRKSTPVDDRVILRASMKNPRLNAKDIKKEVNSPLSVHTIRRRLNEGGRKAMKPLKKPLLKPQMITARMQWARTHKDWGEMEWNKVSISVCLNYFNHFAFHEHME